VTGYIVFASIVSAVLGFVLASIFAQNAIARAREDGWAAHVAHIRSTRRAAGVLAARTRKANTQ